MTGIGCAIAQASAWLITESVTGPARPVLHPAMQARDEIVSTE